MSVTFKNVPVVSSHLSNKPKGKEITLSDVLYMCKVSNTDTVYFLPPVIDTVSLVFPVEEIEAQKSIGNFLIGLTKEPGSGFSETKNPSVGGYWQNIHLTDPSSGERVLIQADKKQAGNFMRFEFNPSKLGKAGLAYFKDRLSDIFAGVWGYADLMQHGKVTRLDVAYDVLNCSIKDLLVRASGKGKSHAYFGVDEEVETIYLGISKGKKNSNFYAYNKRQDLRDKGQPKQFWGLPWTRIEARIIDPKCSLKAIKSVAQKPLDVFEVYLPSLATPPEMDHHWKMFTDSCWHRGIEGALGLLPDELKDKYEVALQQSAEKFWKPDKLWKAFPDGLEKSGLLDP